MEIVQCTEDNVIVRTVPSPFTEEDIDRRHVERLAALKKKHKTDDLWDVPWREWFDVMGETASDHREMAGCDRQSGKPIPGLRRALPIEKLAERWEIPVDLPGWRTRVLTLVAEASDL